jgi:8-oxo-dGTP diphosphatase
MLREIAPTVIFDDLGRLLLQQRDDIPGILYPGAIGLFGGHREGEETFLACAVREIHEELSFYVPPERFDFLIRFEGADPENPKGTLHAEFFLVRELRVSDLTVTEGQLLVVQPNELNSIRQKLTPSARLALDVIYPTLTEEDLKLIRQIIAGGGRKYTGGNIDRSKYDRLVNLGWLTSSTTNISDVEYSVTEKGGAAARAE